MSAILSAKAHVLLLLRFVVGALQTNKLNLSMFEVQCGFPEPQFEQLHCIAFVQINEGNLRLTA